MTEVQICKGNIPVILIDYMCLTPIHNMVTKSTKEKLYFRLKLRDHSHSQDWYKIKTYVERQQRITIL